MAFGDLQSHGGLLLLNKFLGDKSYIEGYHPTQGDLLVFEAVKKAPSADLENVLRWYKHIASFTDEEKQKFDDQHQFKSLSVNPADVDIDLFGDEDEEESEQTKQRLAAYRERKARQPVVIAKSSIVLDVKPWDDETNMEELEKNVRSIELDGLLWGASHLVPVAYGIRILQITCVVEDDKVGTDTLEERITDFKDHIQSMDISSFRRI